MINSMVAALLKGDFSTPKKAPAPKARKRQAVTKTFKQSTIALVRHNAASSPLLSLPSEVRERILRCLLGDRLIHIRYLDMEEEEDYNDVRGLTKMHAEKEGSFRHTTCTTLSSFDTQVEAFGDNSRHKDCTVYGRVDEGDLAAFCASVHCPMKEALSILSVCRQLYEECNFILWSTNTFSFDHAGSLIKFVVSLNPAQKRNFKKMHIIVNPDMELSYVTRWYEALAPKYLNMFRGLESLSLSIEHHFYDTGDSISMERYDQLWRQYLACTGLVSLRVLPIKFLNLAINDCASTFASGFPSVYYLPAELKAEHANVLREMLLDPQGAEVQRSLDAEASRRRREESARMNELYEARRLRTAQDNVEATRKRLEVAEVEALKLEGLARQGRQELQHQDQVLRDQERIQEQMENKARKARAIVGGVADSLKIWEDRLKKRLELADAKAAKAAKAAKDGKVVDTKAPVRVVSEERVVAHPSPS